MMTDEYTSDESQDQSDHENDNVSPSRRTFLQATAAAGVVGGMTGLGLGRRQGQEGDQQGFFAQGTEVGTQVVADGQLTAPTDFAVATGENERQFVADQVGTVWEITEDGLSSEPFIDVSDRMVELGTFYGLYADQGQDYDERGLLGIEFHPDFQNNRRFYLHYSAPPTEELRSINWDHIEIVSEFQANEDMSSGNPDSERQLLRIPSPQYNHDAGPIAFGPDGYLYVPMGDGGGANDNMYGHVPDWYDQNTGGNGQDLVHNMLGDVLRIDVDSEGENTPYGIPQDNPFAGDSSGIDEIYAYGFRNPFGISFDSQGNMFVADAGQNLWEEANVVERGGNYGWNVREGTHCFSTEQPSNPSAITDCPSNAPDEQPYGGAPLVPPIVEFPHEYQGEFVGITIVGGHRYEGSTISGLQGKYVFGSWTGDPTRAEPQGRIFTATPPDDFGQGGTTTETGNQTAGNETTGVQTGTGEPTDTTTSAMTGTETGNETVEPAETEAVEKAPVEEGTPSGNQTVGNQTTGNQTTGNETVEPAETEAVEKAPVEEGTPSGNQTTTGDVPPPGPEVVPRDQLWEMQELVFTGEFNWFVRMFGQDSDGEVYVLANKRGVPTGETGAVLKLVPPGEGDTPTGETTQAGTTESGNATTGGETTEGGTTTEGGNATTDGGNATTDGNATDA